MPDCKTLPLGEQSGPVVKQNTEYRRKKTGFCLPNKESVYYDREG